MATTLTNKLTSYAVNMDSVLDRHRDYLYRKSSHRLLVTLVVTVRMATIPR